MIHELPLERRTLHGHFSRELEPVLTIDAGDTVRGSTLDARWTGWDEPPPSAGHALCGPIGVRGARAGQTLSVRVDALEVGPDGFTSAGEHVLRWAIESGVARSGRFELELAPFLGVIGMPPPEPGVHPTWRPTRWGGNLDCKELVPGSTLYLPIPVDGALLSFGDGHGRQGDGEVAGTAIECAFTRVELTVGLRDDVDLATPIAETPAGWVTLGLGATLDEAAERATGAMLDLMEREHGLARPDALALASLVVDLRVTQVVNGTVGVHAVLAYPPAR